MLAVHCYQKDSYEITMMVYEPENYENVKRNFRFPAVGNLLQHETEVGCFTKRDLAKGFIKIVPNYLTKKSLEFH